MRKITGIILCMILVIAGWTIQAQEAAQQAVTVEPLTTLEIEPGRDRMEGYIFAWAPDGKALAVADDDGNVLMWDTVTGKRTTALEDVDVVQLAFNPDGTLLAVSGNGGNIIVFDAAVLARLGTVNNDNIEDAVLKDGILRNFVQIGRDELGLYDIQAMRFSRDSAVLLVYSGQVSLWDIREPLDASTLDLSQAPPLPPRLALEQEIEGAVDAGIFVATYEGFLMGIRDTRAESLGLTAIKIDAAEGMASLVPGPAPIAFGESVRLKLSADGAYIVALTRSGEVRVIDIASGQQRVIPAVESGARVFDAAVGAGGMLAATAYSDRSIKLWDLRDDAPRELHMWDNEEQTTRSWLSFSPDNSRLVQFDRDAIRGWALSSAAVEPTATVPLTPDTPPISCQIDLSDVVALLVRAQAAASAGDQAGAVGLLADARSELEMLAAQCQGGTETPSADLPMVYMLESRDGTLTVRYPAGWVLQENRSDEIELATSDTVLAEKSLNQSEIPTFLPGEVLVNVAVGDVRDYGNTGDLGQTPTALELVEVIAAQVDEAPGMAISNTMAVTVGGKDAAQFTATSDQLSLVFILVPLGTPDSYTVFGRVALVTAPGEVGAYESLARAMAESLVLDN